MIVATFLFSLIVVYITKSLYRYFTKTLHYWSDHGIRGPIPLPIFGNFLEYFFTNPNILEEKRLLKYGTVYGFFEFSRPVLTIADPTLIREVAIKQFHNFTNHYNRNSGDEFQKKTLFLMMDDEWKSVRSLINPAFSSSKIKKMFKHVSKCCDNTLKFVKDIADKKKEIVIKDVMMSFTLDTLAKCIFGVETNGYQNPENEFLKHAAELGELKLWRMFVSLLTPAKLQYPLNLMLFDKHTVNYFKDFFDHIFEQRKKQNINNNNNSNDMIDLLMSYEQNDELEEISGGHFANQPKEDFELSETAIKTSVEKKSLNKDEILANSIMLLIAGYETTATVLNFAFYALTMNPDVQQKLFEEVNEFISEHEKVDNESLNSLNYLDAVISEALRLYTPGVFMDRIAKNDCVLGELKVEKGTVINFPFNAMHRNPQYFSNPHEFKPERFLPENRHQIKPYTYLPFGVGPRICIGMRFALMTAKLFLFKFVQRFEVLQTENTPKELKYAKSFMILASEPLFVKFVERK